MRKIPNAHYSLLSKKKVNRYDFIGSNISEKKIGFFGFGRNAKIMSKYAKSFNMKIYYNDLKKIRLNKIIYLTKNKLFKQCDIIIISITLNKNTVKIINNKLLKLSKKNLILINTSRADIIDQKDLFNVLKSNKIGGVALDFLSEKDLKYSKKLQKYATMNNNIILTPHLGGVTSESLQKTQLLVFQRLIKYEKNLRK